MPLENLKHGLEVINVSVGARDASLNPLELITATAYPVVSPSGSVSFFSNMRVEGVGWDKE